MENNYPPLRTFLFSRWGSHSTAQADLKLTMQPRLVSNQPVLPTRWYYRLPSAMFHCVCFFNLHTALIAGYPVPILQMEKQRLKPGKARIGTWDHTCIALLY